MKRLDDEDRVAASVDLRMAALAVLVAMRLSTSPHIDEELCEAMRLIESARRRLGVSP